jgi:hypothetical protein
VAWFVVRDALLALECTSQPKLWEGVIMPIYTLSLSLAPLGQPVDRKEALTAVVGAVDGRAIVQKSEIAPPTPGSDVVSMQVTFLCRNAYEARATSIAAIREAQRLAPTHDIRLMTAQHRLLPVFTT